MTKLIELQKSTEGTVEVDDGWTKVKDKGKRKVGDQSFVTSVNPSEVPSSSTELRDDLEVITIVKPAATLVDHMDAVNSEVLEIAKLIHPAAEEIIKGMEIVKEKEVCANSPGKSGEQLERPKNVGSSTKNKSSGKASGSQKKKKRVA